MGRLLFRACGHSIGMAVLGAGAMAVAGAVLGVLSGIVYTWLLLRLPVNPDGLVGGMGGGFCGVAAGAGTGFITFAIVGAFSVRHHDPPAVYEAALARAWRGAAAGIVVGGALGMLKAFAWTWGRLQFRTGQTDTAYIIEGDLAYSCLFGMVGGFVLGTIIGAWRGAWRAIRDQVLPLDETW